MSLLHSSKVSLVPPFLQEALDLQTLSHIAESKPIDLLTLVSLQRKNNVSMQVMSTSIYLTWAARNSSLCSVM